MSIRLLKKRLPLRMSRHDEQVVPSWHSRLILFDETILPGTYKISGSFNHLLLSINGTVVCHEDSATIAVLSPQSEWHKGKRSPCRGFSNHQTSGRQFRPMGRWPDENGRKGPFPRQNVVSALAVSGLSS